MKVAIVVPVREACGIADYARLIAEHLPAEWDIQWVDTASCRTARDWAAAARRAGESDVAHVHYEYTLFRHVSPLRNGYAAFMRALPIPAVVTLHDAFPVLNRPWKDIFRDGPAALIRHLAYLPVRGQWTARQIRRAARIVAHTRAIADTATGVLPAQHVTWWPHPIPACPRRWSLLNSRAPILITPGFIKPHKGYTEGLDLLARHPDWQWWLAGGPQDNTDQAYLNLLLDRAGELGLGDRLRITGYLQRGDLEDLARQARLAWFPFRSVTGSSSVSWAIGLGLPIAATDLPPLRHMHDAGAGIRLLPSRDPAAWDAPLGDLLETPPELERLSAANARYRETFSDEKFGRLMAHLFQEAAPSSP